MMGKKQIVVALLALAGAWATTAAQARSNVDVQWSVHIPGPIGVTVYSQPPRWSSPAVVVAPVNMAPRFSHGRGDRDRDGIPNRYDRVYNPRWDRDGDGVPNSYDRHDGPRERCHDERHDARPGYRPHR